MANKKRQVTVDLRRVPGVDILGELSPMCFNAFVILVFRKNKQQRQHNTVLMIKYIYNFFKTSYDILSLHVLF